MNDFDKAARHGARLLDPPGFLRWVLDNLSWTEWRWTGWVDTQTVPFPGEPDLRPDTVASFERTAGDAPPLAAVIEFMSQPRWIILERLDEYAFRLRRELPYQSDPRVAFDVIGIVVNLTGAMESGEWSMAPPDCGGLGLWSKSKPRNLSTMDAMQTLASIASGSVALCVLAWISLMRGGGEPATIEEWKRLALTEPDQDKRRVYAGLALVFADLAGCLNTWQKLLEGWNVERSRVTLEWEAHAEARAKRQSLLRALQLRFKSPVPVDISQVIEGQSDHAILDAWFDRALTVSSLEEMRAPLGLNGV